MSFEFGLAIQDDPEQNISHWFVPLGEYLLLIRTKPK
jgi:hypothetical protein